MKILHSNNKILSNNTTFNLSNNTVSTVVNINKNKNAIIDDVSCISFNTKNINMDNSEELSTEQIEKLRAELSSNKITSNLLADVLIGYTKENVWQKTK